MRFSLVVRLPRFTRRSRRPVALADTRSVRRQRKRADRFANIIFTPRPETVSCLREQPRTSLIVRRTIRVADDFPVVVDVGVGGGGGVRGGVDAGGGGDVAVVSGGG